LYEINVNFPFWMGSGLTIAAALLVFLFIKEPKEYGESEKQPNMFESLRELMNDLKTLENFFWPFFAPIYRGFTKLTRTYGGCKWLF